MAGLYSPKTPEREWDEEMMKSLTLAPRKERWHVYLTNFLHENKEYSRDEFTLNSNRVFGYIFHKPPRVVTLYTTDSPGEFIPGRDPCLVFPDKDWTLFYTYVWKDLNDSREEPLYISEWDGVTPNHRYRVVGDHSKKKPDECVYIFCCKDKTKLSDRSGFILQNEHHAMYEMRFFVQVVRSGYAELSFFNHKQNVQMV